jgi:oxalate decarboxylase/phosphoglucose isomerase-like protein (cupin superfamily)
LELNYCFSGRAQIGLVAPDGSVQTFPVEPGTVAFIPQNWFHYIANTGAGPLEFLVFFVSPNAAAPRIDLSQTLDIFAPFAALPRCGDVFLAPQRLAMMDTDSG